MNTLKPITKGCFGGTVLLVLFLASPAFAQRYTVLPQFASGDGWSSDLFIANQAAHAVTGVVVAFYANNGNPLTVDTNLGANSSFTLNLNPGASQVIRLPDRGSLRVGYIVVKAPTGSVTVTEVFRLEQGGVVVAELGVPQLGRHYHFSLPVEVNIARGINTGVALANPTYDSSTAIAQTLVLTLIGSDGVPQRTALVPLGIGAHISQYLNEAGLFPGLDSFTGVLSVSGPRNYAILGLRQDKQAFGSVGVDYGPILSPFVVASSSLAEVEPNNTTGQAQSLAACACINGTIGSAGDLDYFCFNGRKGDVVSAMVDTHGLGSELDSVLRLEKADGTLLATNDQNGLYGDDDSFVQLVLPEDGRYNLRVSDYYDSGGASHTYRLHLMFAGGVTPAQPRITALNPSSGIQGSSTTLVIQGTDLSGAASINFAPATGITISNVQSTAAQVTAQLTIAAGASTGTRQVTVTTPAGTSNALTFAVNPGGGGGGYDGTWSGTISQGSSITLTVSGGKLTSVKFVFNGITFGCCTVSGGMTVSSSWNITGNTFSASTSPFSGSTSFSMTGTFTSSSQVSGTLDLTQTAGSYPQPSCCAGKVTGLTWSASKN